jgi:hypothetical protein
LPTNALGGLPANVLGALPTNALGGLPANVLGALPTNALGGLPANVLGALPTNALGALPRDVFAGVGKVLPNRLSARSNVADNNVVKGQSGELPDEVDIIVDEGELGVSARLGARSDAADNNVDKRQDPNGPANNFLPANPSPVLQNAGVGISVGVGGLGLSAGIGARSNDNNEVDDNDVVKRQLPPLPLPELAQPGILTLTDTTPSQKYCSFDLREAYFNCAAATAAGLTALVDCRLSVSSINPNNNTSASDPTRYGYKEVTYQPKTLNLIDLPLGPKLPDVGDKQGPVYVDFREQGFDDATKVEIKLLSSSYGVGGLSGAYVAFSIDSVKVGLRRC